MTKQEFLVQLSQGLCGLPQAEREEQLAFYGEMIDDRMEEGLSETDAVAALGGVEDILFRVVDEVPLTKIAKERLRSNRRLKGWEILLLVLGSPIWLALGVSAVSVVLAVYVALWSIIVSLWSVFVSLAACAVGGVAAGAVSVVQGNGYAAVCLVAAGLMCGGLSIFTFYGCKAATKGILMLTKKLAVGIKNRCMRKETVV